MAAVLLSVHITYLLALLLGLSASFRCRVFLNFFYFPIKLLTPFCSILCESQICLLFEHHEQ